VCLREASAFAGGAAASIRKDHSLFIIIVEKRRRARLFISPPHGRQTDGRTDRRTLLLPSTFNNEKRSRAFLMCTDTTHSLEMCNAKPIFSGVYINKALHYQR
jgi:hypothetical protein